MRCFWKKLQKNTVQSWCAQALWSHQHTLQLFKNTFLSRNLDQNMFKNALFLEKDGKFAAVLGAPPPAAGGFVPRLPSCYSHSDYYWAHLRLFGIVKINTTYYLTLKWQLVGPLSQACPLWLKLLVTPLHTGTQNYLSSASTSALNSASKSYQKLSKSRSIEKEINDKTITNKRSSIKEVRTKSRKIDSLSPLPKNWTNDCWLISVCVEGGSA